MIYINEHQSDELFSIINASKGANNIRLTCFLKKS